MLAEDVCLMPPVPIGMVALAFPGTVMKTPPGPGPDEFEGKTGITVMAVGDTCEPDEEASAGTLVAGPVALDLCVAEEVTDEAATPLEVKKPTPELAEETAPTLLEALGPEPEPMEAELDPDADPDPSAVAAQFPVGGAVLLDLLVTSGPGLGYMTSDPSSVPQPLPTLATKTLGRLLKGTEPSRFNFLEPAILMTAQFMYISRLPTLFCHVQAKSALLAAGVSDGMVKS